jgi:hypothetical protein
MMWSTRFVQPHSGEHLHLTSKIQRLDCTITPVPYMFLLLISSGLGVCVLEQSHTFQGWQGLFQSHR